jgi:hypothetical protein
MARSQSKVITLPDANPEGPYKLFESENEKRPSGKGDLDNGVLRIEHGDGSITIDFDPKPEVNKEDENDFFANLCDKISEDDLDSIGQDLLEGVKRDQDSRTDWLTTRTRGVALLGTKLKTPKSEVGSSGEGMSSIDHPLILEASVNFQATARAELLPAAGPVKVRNDAPMPPKEVQETNAKLQLEKSLSSQDDLAQAMEKDFNHYLTSTATEYVPDTDRMLFHVGFGGDGFKKVYNCPRRNRPVSESVDAEDLIVSNAATDLQDCGRITHKIMMRKSDLRRMQILGVYRDIDLAPPTNVVQNELDKKLEEVSGVKSSNRRPEDRDYEIYEIYCELDLDEFAPKEFKGKGLPLPYRVTMEAESGKVLDIRRNWKEKDDQCLARQFFVQFPFIRGLGFYGMGYIHLLGNVAITLTAAWRETLDAGMYASFPGFLYNKQAGRQLTNQFRVPPGGGIGLDLGPNQRLQDAVMAIPYKEVGGGFVQFITHVEEVGRKLATTASVAVGEGKQDAPVGTTLALIEQATKVIDSAHKRLHAAQAQEFALLKERFQEDPEAFWRFNKHPAKQWEKQQFLDALENCSLVPVADPNNPTSLHRIAKAGAIKELQKASPDLYDPVAVDMRVMQIVGIDPQGLFKAQPTPAAPDPRMEAIKAKAEASKDQVSIQLKDSELRAQTAQMTLADKQKDRESRERLEAMKIQISNLKLQTEGVIHDKTAYAESKAKEQEIYTEFAKKALEAHINQESEKQSAALDMAKHVTGIHSDHVKHQNDLQHQRALQQDKMAHDKEVAQIQAQAKSKPTSGED